MRNYQRKTNRKNFSQEQLDAALNAITNEDRKIREVSRSHEIPEPTLRRWLKIKKNNKLCRSVSLGRGPIFSHAQEKEIVDHVLHLANLFFGLTSRKIREIAFEYAEENNIKHNFSRVMRMAGKDWLQNFKKRNPGITLPKPETDLTKTEISRYFKHLETVQNMYDLSSDRIYNVDETIISIAPNELNKILGFKGIKQSQEHVVKNISVICAMNAAGSYIPPLFIFTRKRMSPQLERNGPIGAIYTCTNYGSSNEDVFLLWLKHFQRKVHCSKKHPVLLIFDNHSSHISLEIYVFCKGNGIIIVSIPPHESHRLQPLEVTFFGPLKNAYCQQCNLFLQTKIAAGCENKLNCYDVAEIFKNAYTEIANIEKAMSGFKICGIYPLNPDKFTGGDFASFQSDYKFESLFELNQPSKLIEVPQHQPSTSKELATFISASSTFLNKTSSSTDSADFTQHKILPTHQAIKLLSKRKSSRSKQHSEMLTKSPFEFMVKMKESKKNAKNKATKKTVAKNVFKEIDNKSVSMIKRQNVVKKSKNSKEVGKKSKEEIIESDNGNIIHEIEFCDIDKFDDLTVVNVCDEW